MRDDVLSFNLGGMGCSASVISVDLVRRLLRSSENRNCLALVVSTENITQNWYRGNDRSMLLQNCLFRCGAPPVLPASEQLKFFLNVFARRAVRGKLPLGPLRG